VTCCDPQPERDSFWTHTFVRSTMNPRKYIDLWKACITSIPTLSDDFWTFWTPKTTKSLIYTIFGSSNSNIVCAVFCQPKVIRSKYDMLISRLNI
jgi:hypothetical protein